MKPFLLILLGICLGSYAATDDDGCGQQTLIAPFLKTQGLRLFPAAEIRLMKAIPDTFASDSPLKFELRESNGSPYLVETGSNVMLAVQGRTARLVFPAVDGELEASHLDLELPEDISPPPRNLLGLRKVSWDGGVRFHRWFAEATQPLMLRLRFARWRKHLAEGPLRPEQFEELLRTLSHTEQFLYFSKTQERYFHLRVKRLPNEAYLALFHTITRGVHDSRNVVSPIATPLAPMDGPRLSLKQDRVARHPLWFRLTSSTGLKADMMQMVKSSEDDFGDLLTGFPPNYGEYVLDIYPTAGYFRVNASDPRGAIWKRFLESLVLEQQLEPVIEVASPPSPQ